jgi:membrane protein YqaA with SNARE-associated domain
VRAFFASIFGYFLSPFGLVALGALDASMLFFLPFAVDAAVVVLSAQRPGWAPIYAVLATAGSVIGAAGTFWLGRRAGEQGLERFVPTGRLDALKCRARRKGAIAMALPALLPPPFPFTPFILACGALDVSRRRFFVTLALTRLVRFGAGAGLAVLYGRHILRWMQSDLVERVVIGFAVVAVAGTAFAVWKFARQGRGGQAAAEPRSA